MHLNTAMPLKNTGKFLVLTKHLGNQEMIPAGAKREETKRLDVSTRDKKAKHKP